MDTESNSNQIPGHQYKKCNQPGCDEMVDITENPRGALQKHNYAKHPEIRARIQETLEKMHEARRKNKKKVMEPVKAVKSAAKSDSDSDLPIGTPGETSKDDGEDQGASNNGNGNNGHSEDELLANYDLGDDIPENIFLRGIGEKEAPRPRAMVPRMMRADSFGEAQLAAIVPKTIVINPMLMQVGMGITFNEWGWDSKMTPGQWLDEVLKWFFWYCGYEITPWRRLTPQEMGITVEGG